MSSIPLLWLGTFTKNERMTTLIHDDWMARTAIRTGDTQTVKTANALYAPLPWCSLPPGRLDFWFCFIQMRKLDPKSVLALMCSPWPYMFLFLLIPGWWWLFTFDIIFKSKWSNIPVNLIFETTILDWDIPLYITAKVKVKTCWFSFSIYLTSLFLSL